jgi:hypothetical protein
MAKPVIGIILGEGEPGGLGPFGTEAWIFDRGGRQPAKTARAVAGVLDRCLEA